MTLKDKRIWITGASRGIGLAAAKAFAEKGAKLFLGASKPDSFKEVIPLFREYKDIFFFPFEVSDENEINKVYSKIKDIAGGVDILINNAGVGRFEPMTELSSEDFDYMMNINVKGPFLCTKAVLPDMISAEKGSVINVLSISAFTTYPNGTVYGASKAAARAMSRSLRTEVREHGIKIVDLMPGAVATEIWEEELLDKYGPQMMQPGDFAELIIKTSELCLNENLMIEEMVIRPQGGDI